jgi:hypothetical protein
MPAGGHTVTANYICTPYSLSITITGDGSVNKSPSPNCGSGYLYNTTVTLTANPDPFNEFDRWSGSISSTSNPVNITMNGNKSVTADFDPLYPTEVSNLSYTVQGVNGPYVIFRFTWNSAQNHEYYVIWKKIKDTSYEQTSNTGASQTGDTVDNFYRCDYPTGYYGVYPTNPYGQESTTITVDILNSGYYCGP